MMIAPLAGAVERCDEVQEKGEIAVLGRWLTVFEPAVFVVGRVEGRWSRPCRRTGGFATAKSNRLRRPGPSVNRGAASVLSGLISAATRPWRIMFHARHRPRPRRPSPGRRSSAR